MSEILKDDEKLTFYECIQLIDKLADCNIIQRDPNNANNVITYRSADELNPEGWYSQNVYEVAQELYENRDNQVFLLETLKEKGIDFEFTPNSFLTNGGLHQKSEEKSKSKKASEIERNAELLLAL